MKFIRTKQNGSYEQRRSTAWGLYFKKVDDPEGVGYDPSTKFKLAKNFPRLPYELWQKVVQLYRDFITPASPGTRQETNEVEVVFIRNMSDLSEWKVLVPKQKVNPCHVDADMTNLIDLETGERHDVFPPEGWAHAGTSHSHNTMGAFFSATDNESELNLPGMHIVVGKITDAKYELLCSVVLDGRRFILLPSEVIAMPDHVIQSTEDQVKSRAHNKVRSAYCAGNDVTYCQEVKSYITIPKPRKIEVIDRALIERAVEAYDGALPVGYSWWGDGGDGSDEGNMFRHRTEQPQYHWEPEDYEAVSPRGKEHLKKFAAHIGQMVVYRELYGDFNIALLTEMFLAVLHGVGYMSLREIIEMTDSTVTEVIKEIYREPIEAAEVALGEE